LEIFEKEQQIEKEAPLLLQMHFQLATPELICGKLADNKHNQLLPLLLLAFFMEQQIGAALQVCSFAHLHSRLGG